MRTTLRSAVIDQIGGDVAALADVAEHGANTGTTGFTYYSDTVEFFDANRGAILDLVKETASEMGESLIPFIRSFGCIDATEDEVCGVLWEGVDDAPVKNGLAWFALEAVAHREFQDA